MDQSVKKLPVKICVKFSPDHDALHMQTTEINFLCSAGIFHNCSLIALTKSFIGADQGCELNAAHFHPSCFLSLRVFSGSTGKACNCLSINFNASSLHLHYFKKLLPLLQLEELCYQSSR